MTGITLYSVKGVLILDNEGNRVYAKYYEPPHAQQSHHQQSQHNSTASGNTQALGTISGEHNELFHKSLKDQRQFEKGLFNKTWKQAADVVLYESNLVVYKQSVDWLVYIIGDSEENECMLYQTLMGLKEALELVFKTGVDKRTLLEHYDMLSLAVDETVDSGIILESDPVVISSRVSKPPSNDMPSLQHIELNEQGLSNMFNFAKSKIADRLRQL